MEYNMIKDLLESLPFPLFDEKLLRPGPEVKVPERSYRIQDTVYHEYNTGYDSEPVHFEVLQKEGGELDILDKTPDGNDCGEKENAISNTAFKIKKVSDGVLVDTEAYLKDHNWNTLLSLDGLFQCAVCDEVMDPSTVDVHIALVSHKTNLERYKPLTDYELSVVRKIENYNHCGVCNLLPTDLSYHITTEEHKRNYIYAINKGADFTPKKARKEKADIPVDCDSVLVKVPNNTSQSEVRITKDNATDVKPVVNTSVVPVPKLNHVKPTTNNLSMSPSNEKYVSFETFIKSFNNKKNKNTPNVSNKKINKNLHVPSNVNKNYNVDFPSLGRAGKSETVSNSLQNTGDIIGNNKSANNNFDSTTSTGTSFSYASMTKKPTAVIPEFVLQKYGTETFKVRFDGFNMMIRRLNKSFYCMACKETNIFDKLAHCSSDEHLQSLQRCEIVDTYKDILIRKVGSKFLHCSHCNILQFTPYMDSHIAKVHPLLQETLPKQEKTDKKEVTDPVRGVEYTATAKNINVDALKRRASVDSKKSDGSDSVRSSDSPHAPFVPVRSTNSPNTRCETSQMKKPMNVFVSEIKIRPFDLELTLNLLCYNTVFTNMQQLVCALCDCMVPVDPVVHICATQHTEILRLTPFIPQFNNNLIREIRDRLHCALCNILTTHVDIYTHIMNPPHTVLLAKASGALPSPSTSILGNVPTAGPNFNPVPNPMQSWCQPRIFGPQMIPRYPFGPQIVHPHPPFNPNEGSGYFRPFMAAPNMPIEPITQAKNKGKGESTPQKGEKKSSSKINSTEAPQIIPIKDIVNELKSIDTSEMSPKREKKSKKKKDKSDKTNSGVVKKSKKIKNEPTANHKNIIYDVWACKKFLNLENSADLDDKNDTFSDANIFTDNVSIEKEATPINKPLIFTNSKMARLTEMSEVDISPDVETQPKLKNIEILTDLSLDEDKIISDDKKISTFETIELNNSINVTDVIQNKKSTEHISQFKPYLSETNTESLLMEHKTTLDNSTAVIPEELSQFIPNTSERFENSLLDDNIITDENKLSTEVTDLESDNSVNMDVIPKQVMSDDKSQFKVNSIKTKETGTERQNTSSIINEQTILIDDETRQTDFPALTTIMTLKLDTDETVPKLPKNEGKVMMEDSKLSKQFRALEINDSTNSVVSPDNVTQLEQVGMHTATKFIEFRIGASESISLNQLRTLEPDLALNKNKIAYDETIQSTESSANDSPDITQLKSEAIETATNLVEDKIVPSDIKLSKELTIELNVIPNENTIDTNKTMSPQFSEDASVSPVVTQIKRDTTKMITNLPLNEEEHFEDKMIPVDNKLPNELAPSDISESHISRNAIVQPDDVRRIAVDPIKTKTNLPSNEDKIIMDNSNLYGELKTPVPDAVLTENKIDSDLCNKDLQTKPPIISSSVNTINIDKLKSDTTLDTNETKKVDLKTVLTDKLANDDASSTCESILDANEITDPAEPYDAEEYIYLKFKNYVAKITLNSYNSLVPRGDGTRYCFVCWDQVDNDLNQHVQSSKHLDNLKGCKYIEHYTDNMIRWKNSSHHCSVCNVVVIGSLETHLSWQYHALSLLETRKTARQVIKNLKKNNLRQFRAVMTKKKYTCTNPIKWKTVPCDNYFLGPI